MCICVLFSQITVHIYVPPLCYTVQSQASIINDLLDFETLKGASVAAKVTRLDLDATVHSVVRMFNNTVTSKVRDRHSAVQTDYCSHFTALQSCMRVMQ
jgi:type IV secretory pathway TraG/TraD family ATPase VirD4